MVIPWDFVDTATDFVDTATDFVDTATDFLHIVPPSITFCRDVVPAYRGLVQTETKDGETRPDVT